jgi:hypothetical protein
MVFCLMAMEKASPDGFITFCYKIPEHLRRRYAAGLEEFRRVYFSFNYFIISLTLRANSSATFMADAASSLLIMSACS